MAMQSTHPKIRLICSYLALGCSLALCVSCGDLNDAPKKDGVARRETRDSADVDSADQEETATDTTETEIRNEFYNPHTEESGRREQRLRATAIALDSKTDVETPTIITDGCWSKPDERALLAVSGHGVIDCETRSDSMSTSTADPVIPWSVFHTARLVRLETGTIMCGSWNGQLATFDEDGKRIALRQVETDPIRDMEALASGTRVAVCRMSTDVQLYDPPLETPPVVLRGHESTVWAIAGARDADRLATGDVKGRCIVWDVSRRSQLSSVELGSPVRALAMNGRGTRVACLTADGMIRSWNPIDGKVVTHQVDMPHNIGPSAAALDDAGTSLVCGGNVFSGGLVDLKTNRLRVWFPSRLAAPGPTVSRAMQPPIPVSAAAFGVDRILVVEFTKAVVLDRETGDIKWTCSVASGKTMGHTARTWP